MPRRNARVDGNHAEIRDGLRALGYEVFDVHSLPGRLDIDVRSRSGLTVAVEIKMPGERLTKAERDYLDKWPCSLVAYSLQDALDKLRSFDEAKIIFRT